MNLFTSSDAWKKVTNPNRSQSTENLTEDFYKQLKPLSKICCATDRNAKTTLLQALVDWLDSVKYSGNPIVSNTSLREKKTEQNLKSLAKKNKKEDWENFASSLSSNTPVT